MPHPESHLKANQRFKNFWANVSKLDVSKNVPVDTQLAIVRGMEKAYGPEAQGREHDIPSHGEANT